MDIPDSSGNLTAEQKIAILSNSLQSKGYLHFAAGGAVGEQEHLTKLLANTLLADECLCGKAVNSHANFVLHDAEVLPDGVPAFELKGEANEVYIHVLAKADNLGQHINQAITAAVAKQEELADEHNPSMPLSAQDDAVTEGSRMTGSVPKDDSGRLTRFTRGTGGTRGAYDPRMPRLSDQEYAKKHTERQLAENGRARMDNADAGSKWLWKLDHDYVLSDEALKSKNPGRWFRDICVVSGVSTTMLEEMEGLAQSTWSAIQNHRRVDLEPNIMSALTTILKEPLLAGRGRGYTLPAGSLFGLPTVEQSQSEGSVKTVVDPKELSRIAKGLFGHGYEVPEQGLKYLSHLSRAYMQSAISAHELGNANVMSVILQPIFNKYGNAVKYAADSKEYHRIIHFLGADKKMVNPLPVIESLRAINEQYWHMPAGKFEHYMKALVRLPKNGSIILQPLPEEEAFEFAQKHHDGTLRSFVRTYRQATGVTQQDVAHRLSVRRQAIQQAETQVRPETLAKRILADENAWQLPEDGEGEIRADVREYIAHFDKQPASAPKESYWLSSEEALAEFAGIEQSVDGGRAARKLDTAIREALDSHPDRPYVVISLDGHDVLVKRSEEGKPLQLYVGDLGPWYARYAKAQIERVTKDAGHIKTESAVPSGPWTERVVFGRNPAQGELGRVG